MAIYFLSKIRKMRYNGVISSEFVFFSYFLKMKFKPKWSSVLSSKTTIKSSTGLNNSLSCFYEHIFDLIDKTQLYVIVYLKKNMRLKLLTISASFFISFCEENLSSIMEILELGVVMDQITIF